MKILLLQIDGKLPNVALMRIAAHHRALGHAVTLKQPFEVLSPMFDESYDLIYGSLIFQSSAAQAQRARALYPRVVFGGTGIDKKSALEDLGITTLAQDYSIYPKFQPSIGFTQRGCRLSCKFCVVPEKEGRNREEKTIAQLWRGAPYPKQLLLLDNDFFGQPNWRERIDEIKAGGFKVCFSQGINCRMINDDAARAIASINYTDDSFKVRRIYTAWDNLNDEERLFAGLNALVRHGVKPDHIMVYILIGYWPNETEESRDYRRRKLREFGARPYPMPFVRNSDTVGFQRWVIGAYDKTIDWQTWKRARFQPSRIHKQHFELLTGI